MREEKTGSSDKTKATAFRQTDGQSFLSNHLVRSEVHDVSLFKLNASFLGSHVVAGAARGFGSVELDHCFAVVV